MEQHASASKSATVAVTGATGYIGQAVVRRLGVRGHRAIALSRRPSPAVPRWRSYDLTRPLAANDLDGVDAVIHLAAETDRGPLADADREAAALARLIEACRDRGARLVFVSSQTAQENAVTGYGRAKWRCEEASLAAAGIVVRPGQVYGGEELGLFGSLCKLVRTSPFIPRLLPDPVVQPVHVDDLAEALVICATSHDIRSGIYQIAEAEPVTFTSFLRMIADVRFSRRVISLPLPIQPVIWLAHAPALPAAVAGVAQRLHSLATLPTMDTPASVTALGLSLRPLREGLARSGHGRRRLLIAEARTLFRYILRGLVPLGVVKHYVRSVEALHAGQPLLLHPAIRRWPFLLAIVDVPLSRRGMESDAFLQRLDLATACAETSSEAAGHFLLLDARPRAILIIRMIARLALDGLTQLAGLIGAGFFRRWRPLPAAERFVE
jgi:NADH dehydrogenase